MAGRHAFDHGQQVLWDVAGPSLSVHTGCEIIGRVFEAFGGDGADEEVEVIDDFLGEPLAAGFKRDQAGHGNNGERRRVYTPITAAKNQDKKRLFSKIRFLAPKSAKLLQANGITYGVRSQYLTFGNRLIGLRNVEANSR